MAGKDTESAWAGALFVADGLNDLRTIREAILLIGQRVGALKVR